MHVISDAADLGKCVRQARQRAKLSQTDLAESVGTTRQWLSRFEQGSNDVSLGTVFAILRELDITWHVTEVTEDEKQPQESGSTLSASVNQPSQLTDVSQPAVTHEQASPTQPEPSSQIPTQPDPPIDRTDRASLFRSRDALANLSQFARTGGAQRKSGSPSGAVEPTAHTDATAGASPNESVQSANSGIRHSIEADIARISQSTLFKKHRK